MRISSAITAPLLVLTLALAGCGGDDSDDDDSTDGPSSQAPDEETDETEPSEESEEPEDDGPDQVDACALLSPADLKAAFDSPFDEGQFTHQEQTGGDQCVWSNTDAPPVKVFSVTVLREGHLSGAFEDGGVTVQQLHEDTKSLTPEAEEVDLGDDAFIFGTTLYVLVGDTSYSFTTTTGDSAEAIEGMKTLAAQIVG